MAAIKCNIPSLALQQLSGLIYGFNCTDVVCKIAENYLEYLGCPIDHHSCQPAACTPSDPDVVTCLPASASELTVGTITYQGATLTFVASEHPSTLTLTQGITVVNVRQNPTSPVVYTGLLPDTTYVATLVVHCPHGEDRTSDVEFHTLPVCVMPLSITAIAEDVFDF